MKGKFSSYFSNSDTIVALLLSLLCVYLLFPAFFINYFFPLPPEKYFTDSLDPSWALTLNYATIKDFEWGSEYTFTHGPLAYLGLRVGWGASRYSFVLYDIFYFLNLFAVCYLTYKRSFNKAVAAILIIVVSFIFPTYIGGSNALILFFFLIFWIRHNIEKQNHLYYLMQVALISLLFYTKFNTAFISLILYYSSLIYISISGKDTKKWLVVGYALLPPASIWVLAFVLNVNMQGYIVSGFEYVAGYNHVMYLSGAHPYMLYLALLIIFIAGVYFTIRLYCERQLLVRNFMVFFLFSATIYILYKQAFVRGDLSHNLDFFKYTVLLLLCVGFFTDRQLHKIGSLAVMLIVGISLYMHIMFVPTAFSSLKGKTDKGVYFKQFSDFEPQQGIHLTPPVTPLPKGIITTVGNTTIDVFPTNVYMLYENNLNYLPRPVMQSYAAYTQYLENVNFDHYNSPKAPGFVIYEYGSIDGRYPLLDESKVNLVLKKNYTIADTFTLNGRYFLLLKKKKDATPLKIKFLREYAMYKNSPIIPKKNIYYEVNFYTTFEGKIIKSLLKHAPEINITLQTESGNINEFRTSMPLLESGIFSDYTVLSTEDFKKYISNDTSGTDRKIKQIVFKPGRSGDFKEKIRIKEYLIE